MKGPRILRFVRPISTCLALTMAACGSGSGDQPRLPERRPEATAPTEAATGSPAQRSWSFDETTVDGLPEGFSVQAGEWSVEREIDAPGGCCVLVQQAASASSVFNLLLIEGLSRADVDISLQLRARQGRIDQGGGVVWRARDARNYYVARYNPLEGNYRVYFVEDGQRRQLGSADVRLDPGTWHALRVRMVGDHIECFLDGHKHLDVHDGTFTEPGQVGLWTKADAKTQFDELGVYGLDSSELDAGAIGEITGVQATTACAAPGSTWSRCTTT